MIASLLLVLAVASAADSTTPPTPVLTLPEVSVESARPVVDARRRAPTGFVSDVRAGETGHAIESVGELLGSAAAVRIQRYGGLGSFTTLSLRGAAASQLSVYLDGMPLTSASGSVVNLADLPATAVERLEVYRGVSPIEFGPVTPGGAINVVTLTPSNHRQFSLTRGSFGEWQGTATAGARHGRWSALLHAGFQGGRGDFDYWDDNGTPLNPADDGTSLRQNNRYAGRVLLGTVQAALPLEIAMTLREDLFNKSQGVPGLGAVPVRATHLALDRALSLVEFRRPGSGVAPALQLQLSSSDARSRFRDPQGELGFGRISTDDRFRGSLMRGTAASPRLARFARVNVSLLLRDERAQLHTGVAGRPDPAPSRRSSRGASVELRLEPWPDRVLLTAARRWDRQRDALNWTTPLGLGGASDLVREFDAPQLGAQWRVVRAVKLKANLWRSQRAPEFLELFGNEGSVRGNPELRPERAQNWDAGGEWTLAPGRAVQGMIEWAHYEQHASDLIAYPRNSATSVKAMNVSRARIRGEELSAKLRVPHGIALSAWCAWQGTLDQGTIPIWRGRRLPQRPERLLSGQIRWTGDRADLSLDVDYLGEDFMDSANRMRVASRTLVGAAFGLRVLPGARFSIDAKNLGNAWVSDIAGFPLPGRGFYVSCEWDGAPAHP